MHSVKSTSQNSLESKILSLIPVIFLVLSHIILIRDDSGRMYLPYMTSSYVIAGIVYFFYPLPFGKKSIGEYFFSKKVWLHPSANDDYILFIFNFIFYFHCFAYLLIDWHFLSTITSSTLDLISLPKPSSAEPGLVAAIIYTIGLTLLGEFIYYWIHRIYHEVPFFWELHKIHHSAEVMTPITFIRCHPIDLYIQNTGRLIGVAIASGVFMYFYPNKEGAIMVAGIDAGAFIYYFFGANLHHSNIWISFGKPLEYIFISPAQHQIHHSTNPKHFDKNYGSMLSIWDWLFGSLYIPEKYEEISFGLGQEYKDYNSTPKLLWAPMREMFLIATGKKKTPKKTKKKK